MEPRVGQPEREVCHSDSGWDLRNRRVGALGFSSLSLLGYREFVMHAIQWPVGETQTPPSKDQKSCTRMCVCEEIPSKFRVSDCKL
jgi:hypothetical protein